MANALYDKGRNAFLTGGIDWENDTIKCTLVDIADYTVDLALHDFFDDIVVVPAAEVATVALATKTAVDGVADAADITFTGVTGDQSEALVIWKDTGTPATSPLIAYIDTATGLPVTPNTGDIIVQWSDGANKIFKL